MSRLLKRALLVGLGAYVVAVTLAAFWAIQHPESYIHVTPLQGFGINAVAAVFILLVVTAGAATGLLVVRSRPLGFHALWFFLCGLLVAILARLLPTFPSLLGACPTGEVCNPYHWSQAIEWLREPFFAFAATAILGIVSSHGRLPQPNKSLERTREG
jgi:hypothetical protein